MKIYLGKPYKIIALREKRYDAHYNIPSSKSLVVPVREYGGEFACDVRWTNDDGNPEVIHHLVFASENLESVNALVDEERFELWEHYYGVDMRKDKEEVK